ncbi:hypothetical protein [Aquimarina algiphila]|uniref:hypothetical protein n=1 Tax=Aquimarina algiphila TaxID=2047982 RepID=UPI00249395CB|nr:hypothetical protein [Aquimarina algiphila]
MKKVFFTGLIALGVLSFTNTAAANEAQLEQEEAGCSLERCVTHTSSGDGVLISYQVCECAN